MVHRVYDVNEDVQSGRNPSKPPPKQIYHVSEPPYEGYHAIDQSAYRNSAADSTIVIDNGSSTVRAGWQFDKAPRISLPPLMARYTDRKLNRKLTFIGSELYFDGTARGQAKNIYEPGSNIVNNWDVQEGILDYIFIKMGLDGSKGSINRPVLMTEPLGNMGYSRRGMHPHLL